MSFSFTQVNARIMDAVALQDRLRHWTDFDEAAHAVAACLGLMPPEWEWAREHAKWVFWSDNPTGNMLHNVLRLLVECGVLEHDLETERYRFNPHYVRPSNAGNSG